ncbi:PucR-like helix-turn-helix protein [Anaerobacterium chartisolvens]|uniref:PucR-like helix-turn-helix protein n=1 Tax=Anaerobacterium chartisolvens TaxID=1297424 RepID=A0A369B3Z4_9FIRM|nr:helix-turn-helix domain-containing protein [Anaerobacterium chartisolvens]RCX16045.1 PucR-like helix-turn-helix protein [Anaerobacterium chartisolvens]
MDLHLLITRLGDMQFEIRVESDFAVELLGYKMLSKGQQVFLPHIIYYGYASQLPEVLPDDTVINIISYCDVEIRSDFFTKNNLNLILIKKDFDAELIFEKLQQLFIEDQQIISDMKLLLDALFSEMGLQYITDVASAIFENPVFIVDTSFKYIAKSKMVLTNDPDLQEELNLGYILDKNVQSIKKSRLDEKVRKNNYPFYLSNKATGKGMLIVAVSIHQIEVAHIALYELNRKFSENDYKLLYNLGNIVSQELQKNELYKENKGLVYSNLLADMLENKVGNIKDIHQRFRVLGYTLKENLYVLATSPKGYKSSKARHNIAEQLIRLLPGSIYVIYRDTIVLLLSRPKNTHITEYEFQELEAYLSNINQIAGLSICFSDIWEIQRYYKQALKASELGVKLNDSKYIFKYENYSIFHMIELCGEHENLWNFCCPTVRVLLEYDKKNDTVLLKTLYHYLKNLKNPTKTSAELHIHKNTLFYRVDKIKNIIGSNLENGDELAEILISVKILFYLGESADLK